jgi:LuxR family maltose regulon positive regulatory protein
MNERALDTLELSLPQPVLVRSKLLIPDSAGLLHRPRVQQAIERGLRSKLTIVSAPAGYGKTSALVDFAQQSPVPVCWYTADERDRDLGAFVEYLIAAVREQFPAFGRHGQAASLSHLDDLIQDPTGIVADLTNDMIEIGTHFVIVVDNYEALNGTFGIRTFVHRLLETLPSNCHIMLGSRTLPDVPVTRLVARRQLIGLTDQELRFAPQEVRDLLESSQIAVSRDQAEAIAAQSEGWITGILLLAGLLRQETEAILVDRERASAETYDYLVREVFVRQPPDIQHFLLTSSVLREMSSRLCREILGISEPNDFLAELERRNLFITRFGKGRAATYRYHNLFRGFLHRHLRRHELARCDELHRRAAEWFERYNDVEEAVYHYLTVGIYPEATVLMERTALEWFTRGRIETLLRWAESLSEEAKDQAPRLSLYHSKALTDRYEYDLARRALAHAEAGFAAQKNTDCLAKVYIQRATLSLFAGRYEDTIKEAQSALDTLDPHEVADRAQAQRLVGRAYVGLGRLDAGIARLQDALALLRQAGGPYDVVNLLQDLTPALTSQGRFEEAVAGLREALIMARRLGASTQLAGVLHNLGYIHHMRGEYREALALYEEGLSAARHGGVLWLQANTSVGMADLYRDLGAYDRAEILYRAGRQMAQENDPSLVVYILAAQADMHRWQGDLASASELLREANQLAEAKGLDFERRGLLLVAEGLVLAESGRPQDGLHRLLDGASFLENRRAKRELARARFLLARAHLLAGHKRRAIEELQQTVALAEEIGTHQFAVVEGQHDEGLLQLGIAEGVNGCRDIAAGVRRLRAIRKTEREENNSDRRAADHLEIYAFGEGRVVRDGLTVSSSEWQAAMAKEVFFYILLHGPVERDAVGTVFWPDLSQRQTVSNFHSTLHRIRRALGPEAVVTDDGQYRVGDVDYWLDVDEFTALIERARLLPPQDWQTENLWRRAIALYRGDFLSEAERVWCISRRATLQEMYLEALVGVGRCCEARKELEEAINWYRRSLEVDALQEDVHRHVMHCYIKAGRRADALAQYHCCRETLMQELHIETSPETDRLYRQIAKNEVD